MRPRLISMLLVAGTLCAGAAAGAPARIEVRGVSWWKARELKQVLRLLEPEDGALTTFDAAFVEDAVVLLQSAMERDGHLASAGSVALARGGETIGVFPWQTGALPRLSRDLVADRAEFRVDPGVRYHYDALTFAGLHSVEPRVARAFFVDEGFLLPLRSGRSYAPADFERGMDSLREHLVRLGYAGARVEGDAVVRDATAGEVAATVRVGEGLPHRVGAVRLAVATPQDGDPAVKELCSAAAGTPLSPLWQQDFLQSVRGVLYAKGYARPGLDLALVDSEERDGAIVRTYTLTVDAGPRISFGAVRFTGTRLPRESVLRRAITATPGAVFNRADVEQDRLRLGSLGVFSSVRARVDAGAPDVWDLTYELEPAKQLEVSLLGGYGSYERFRGGVEVLHSNLLQRAHRGRLQLVQSMKSTSGDYQYTVPQIFGTTADLSARGFGLLREEVSFDRQEAGVGLGVRKQDVWLGFDAALRYQYESVGVDNVRGDFADVALETSRVAALTVDLTRDRRDNPISPRRGTYLAATVETAARAIGGEVDYQRLEVRAAWHRIIGNQLTAHVGFRHSVLWDLGSGDEMPLAKRFFPGGENSIRGFREGRASPRAPDRSVVGAESSSILNLELEQGLAGSLSVVVFLDAGLTGEKLRSYPGDEFRLSAGAGLRFNTLIGPARIEYGHNVVKEAGDAVGQVHVALGFPF